jgi:hypothetical protein
VRKTCKRRVRDPMACIVLRLPLTAGGENTLALPYHAALAAFVGGVANVNHWRTLADIMNMARGMCKDGLGEAHTATILKAQEALLHCEDRYLKLTRWGLTGDEIQAVRASRSTSARSWRG